MVDIPNKIRIAERKDVENIALLASGIFLPNECIGLKAQLMGYLNNPETMKLSPEQLADRGICVAQEWYVAEAVSNGELLGFSGIEKAAYEGDFDIAWLNWTGIQTKFQGNGLGRKLLEHVEDKAKEYGINSFFVETNPYYPAAVRMYERHGFVLVAKIPDYYGPGKDVLQYRKEFLKP